MFKRIFLSLIIILLALWTKPFWNEPVREFIPESVSDSLHSMKEFASQMIDDDFTFDQLQNPFDYSEIAEGERVEKPELSIPIEQAFSIGNIEIGDNKDKVNQLYGDAKRDSKNEYGLNWFTYHEDYQNFIMVAYDKEEIVRGLFTNQDLFSSQFDLDMSDTKMTVNEILGEPEELIHYHRFSYQINSEGEYDVYLIDGSYLTIFYDLHEDNRITAIQLIDQDLEASKEALYSPASEALKEGFEYQLFDLINATRVNHDLAILSWDADVSKTASKHSADMVGNEFFSHTNLQNKTFSDRMLADEIIFTLAGENLAYGQFSSIFAHQGLMNSEGHRENILHKEFTKLGIGVDFNEQGQPYYTENYFAN